MLSPRERLNKVLQGEKVDRPPCICPGGMMNMVTTELMDEAGVSFPEAHLSADLMAELAAAVYEKGCFENFGVPFCMTIEAENLGAEVDLGTKKYEPHVVKYAIDSVTEWEKIPPINPGQGRAETVIRAIQLLKSKNADVPVIGNITGPISTAGSIMEPVTFYKELRRKNKAAHEMVDFITDQLILFAREQIKAGADMIAISDPSATGEILGPKRFEEFAVRYINKLVASISQANVKTIVHICGQMKNVYPQVNLVSSNVLSFDSIVSMKQARQNLSDRVLMGNVSTYTIEFGSPRQVAGIALKCAGDGADIISPACGLGTKSPLKNVQSIIKAFRDRDGANDA